MTTLPIEPHLFWGLVFVGGVVLGSLLVIAAFRPLGRDSKDPLTPLIDALGLSGVNQAVFLNFAFLWAAIFLALYAGLLWLTWDVIWAVLPTDPSDLNKAQSDWRFTLTKVAALTAVLGAVVAFPLTLIRVKLTREQTETSKESLFNEKLSAAAESLHAQRQTTDLCAGQKKDVWSDDILRRIAAIDRLEGLASEQPAAAPRITRLLCVYLRVLSKTITPEHEAHPRADMEAAAQTIGRMRRIPSISAGQIRINLRKANLQGFELNGLNYEEADFREAKMRQTSLVRANLTKARIGNADMRDAKLTHSILTSSLLTQTDLQGARLVFADMRRADFDRTLMQGSNLRSAKMQGATLKQTRLENARLVEIEIDQNTSFEGVVFNGAAVRNVDLSNASIASGDARLLFGDTTVRLPSELARPKQFRKKYATFPKFIEGWRAWQKEIGFDPDNPGD